MVPGFTHRLDDFLLSFFFLGRPMPQSLKSEIGSRSGQHEIDLFSNTLLNVYLLSLFGLLLGELAQHTKSESSRIGDLIV